MHSVLYAYDNILPSIITKLNAWSAEMRAPWERDGECVGSGEGQRVWGWGQNTVRKKNPDMPNRRDSRSCSDSAPAAGRGRERERRGVEPLPSAQAWNWRRLTLPPPPPPLYSVLSSRCQEVAQCLFCFLLKVCVILHVSFCLFVFILKNWRSRLVVRKFQVALCVSSCRQSHDCLI